MREINADELKKIQLEILDTVNNFCTEKNIKFWLDSGTLLGAIRHKGYIPWDDDVDIGMLREDFERFISLFNKMGGKYKVICNELDRECIYPYAKILDTDTVLYEPDIKNGVKLSVNIDLFVYDVTPGGDETKKQYDCRDKYSFLNDVQYNRYPSKTWYKKVLKGALCIALRLFPRGFFSSRMVKNSKRYAESTAMYVGNFTAETRMLCEKKVFDSFVMKEFEGKEYPVPAGYDAWLTAFYGDYMKLPPVEKRVSHHTFKAYIEEDG